MFSLTFCSTNLTFRGHIKHWKSVKSKKVLSISSPPFFLNVASCIFSENQAYITFIHQHTNKQAHAHHQCLSFLLSIQTLLAWSSVSVNGFVVSHLHPAAWCSFAPRYEQTPQTLPPQCTTTKRTHTNTQEEDREFCQPTSLFLHLPT